MSLNIDKIKIIGGYPLKGKIKIQGAKNSALPIVVTSILTEDKLVLHNVPDLSDMHTIFNILKELNTEVSFDKNTSILCGKNINQYTASSDLVTSMRASILILGPLLARFQQAVVPLPGGCSIGRRPVDMHIVALEKMGATIKCTEDAIVAKVSGRLQGAEINFETVSVGATENIMMAATLAVGTTTIINAAKEPEIIDLANCLNKMGAKVVGAGTDVIDITGVDSLHGAEHSIIGDRIVAGSYALATLATQGRLILENIEISTLGHFLQYLGKTGAEVNILSSNSLEVISVGDIKPVDVLTAPFPEFPTDLQSPFMSLMCLADGKSAIRENIFENRFTQVEELKKMGAKIEVDGQIAIIEGVKQLNGATVKATDLRSAFCLIIASLAAKGETTIVDLHHLDRGYVETVENLSKLGAKIRRGVDI